MNDMRTNRVSFRDFEERDIDFVYRTKQNQKINNSLVGDYSSPFSYKDAEDWVRGCQKQNVDYKFWAICTNDEFQNIIGWCSLNNIDEINKKAQFHGVTINNPKFNDGDAWYETYNFVLDYVFRVLGYNRLYSPTLTNHKLTMTFNELFFNSLEGVLKQAIYRNGQYYDVAIHAIMKDEYDSYKSQGLLDYDVYISKMKDLFKKGNGNIVSLNDFVEAFRCRLETTDPSELKEDSLFRNLDEWSSLFAIEIVAMIEDSFIVKLDVRDIEECETVKDLYDKTQEKCRQSLFGASNIDDSIKYTEGFLK